MVSDQVVQKKLHNSKYKIGDEDKEGVSFNDLLLLYELDVLCLKIGQQ